MNKRSKRWRTFCKFMVGFGFLSGLVAFTGIEKAENILIPLFLGIALILIALLFAALHESSVMKSIPDKRKAPDGEQTEQEQSKLNQLYITSRR